MIAYLMGLGKVFPQDHMIEARLALRWWQRVLIVAPIGFLVSSCVRGRV